MIPSLAKRREPLSYSIDKLGRRDEIVLKSSMRVLDHRFRHHWNFQESGGDVRVTTDAQGRVWIAHWGGACVSCHHPETAQELGRVHLPTSHVTNCAFGGADLQTLFISTARTGLSPEQLAAQPLAGGLFAVDVGSPGVPAHLFGG